MVVALLLVIVLGVAFVYFRDNQTQESTSREVQNESPSMPVPTQADSFSWENLDYITTVDWPPQIDTENAEYDCVEAGEIDARSGKTEERTINGKVYCVTEIVEGAAGSVYTQYAYKTESSDGTIKIATFSIREVQCGNYEEPEMTECEDEQSSFDIDSAIAPELQKIN